MSDDTVDVCSPAEKKLELCGLIGRLVSDDRLRFEVVIYDGQKWVSADWNSWPEEG